MGRKLLYFCSLELYFEKTVVIFEISTLEFIKNEGPGSTFSEGPGPGLGLLYKVRQLNHIPWVISYVSSDYDYIYESYLHIQAI